jgi:ornithine carbamoyltransferase
VATPAGYELPPADVTRIQGQCPGLTIEQTSDPRSAVRGADCIVTDTWVSMGQEEEKARRVKDFVGFCVDESLMAAAPSHAVVLHCLPAYRGYEISDGVIESARSLVFQEAHNRLHAQKAVLVRLLAPKAAV